MSAVPVRLLVLEDDASLSDVLCESMRDRGHAPLPARSVGEALQLLERDEFEVALLDLMLPDGSGLDVLRRIVEEALPTEAIVLTGHATVDTALQAPALVSTAGPDVLLLDLGSSPARGLEVLKRLKSAPGAPAVVAMTLFDTPETAAAASRAGADAVVGKESFVSGFSQALARLFP